ncbi:MAG: o-succinylbenzoate synthase [Almyronema sp.]
MSYRFEFRLYHRPFQPPLQTRHGTWTVRTGILLRLIDQAGQISYGEIVPLPWFGTETLDQALDYCRHCPTWMSAEAIAAIPSQMPACQFGFGAARAGLAKSLTIALKPHLICGLLPTGSAALTSWPTLWQKGHRTFKWKISVADLAQELAILEKLVQALPPQARLRLDANGGLTFAQAQVWLNTCDRLGIEFLEQPLPPDHFETLQQLSHCYHTPIALDESVATLTDLKRCYAQGWPGLFVVKAAIAGFPSQLLTFCQTCRDRLIFSSVFETPIGQQAVWALAAQLHGDRELAPEYALGFGTEHWFADTLTTNFEQLWQQL